MADAPKQHPIDRLLEAFMESVRPASDRSAGVPYAAITIDKATLRVRAEHLLQRHQEYLEEEVLLSPLRARIKELEAELETHRQAPASSPTPLANEAEAPAP